MSLTIDLSGKVALLTGAAGGLGRATTISMAQAGARLCLVDINQSGLDQFAEELGNEGTEVLTIVADLSEPEECHRVVATTLEKFGRLDALCNIAGVMIMAHTTEMTPQQFNKIINVNLGAPFFLSQAAIPHLLETRGAIVNVSSCAAHMGQAYLAIYTATKAGLNNMTRSMAMEYIKKPIRINAVSPGGMMTELAASMRLPEGAEPELVKRFSPLRGLVDIEKMADFIVYLVSDAAEGFHGACISMDQGIVVG